MDVLTLIHTARSAHRPLLSILLDPDKPLGLNKEQLQVADLIMVGGSTGSLQPSFIEHIRHLSTRPIVLFPGNPQQFSALADALCVLSVLSGRNAELLVGQHVRVARTIAESHIETIPMGYILIDGGCETSVVRATGTQPLSPSDPDTIIDTAIAAQLLGKQLVYLEAGSGAKTPVSTDIIRSVRQHIDLPLIVGGGIRSPRQMEAAWQAGADMVVIGNWFELHPEQIPLFRHE